MLSESSGYMTNQIEVKLHLRQSIIFIIYFLSASALFATNVLLKSGGVIKGKVVNQDANQMIIIDESGISRTILKSNILKTVYKEYSEQELAAIRKEEERKLMIAKQKKETTNNLNKTTDSKGSQSILTKQFVLSSVEENCFFHASKVEWYWLYGNFSISNPDVWQELLPEDDRPIKVIFKSTWIDTTLTLLIGSLTSISRKTRQIEVCEF